MQYRNLIPCISGRIKRLTLDWSKKASPPHARFLLAVALFNGVGFATPSAFAAEENIAICHAGLIKLPSFERHVKGLLASGRYLPEQIEKLKSRNRKGGPAFFSSQIIVQEHFAGSGTFDLRFFHGISRANYRNVTAWACESKDYPIVYFVGYRVRQIEDGAIFVSREKDVVNVISLKALDDKLSKGFSVKIFNGDKILCTDIGKSCNDSIFYDRYEY